jgi:hypothetical protein
MIGAGCGSSTPIGSLFPKAYAATINAKSAKVTIAADIRTPKGAVTSTGSGGFDWGDRQGQLTQSTAVPGTGSVSVTEVIDGTDLYVEVPAAARSAVGKPWVKVSLAQLEGSPGAQDPTQILSVLNAQSTSVTKVGTEQIGGVGTTHYRAQVDLTKSAPNAGPAAQRLLTQLPALTGSSTLPMDVWIDGTGKPRQLRFSLTLNKPPAGASPAAAQAFPETTTVTLGLSDYGTPVHVTVPPPDQVSTQSLPGLTGNVQGG